MASLTDNIMQQLSFFLHQRLSSVAQEMLVQVERALTLALDQEKTQSPDLQTPVPAAPEADRNQPITRPIHEAPYNIKQEFVDQSNEAQDCDVKEPEEPIQELEGLIEPISEDDEDYGNIDDLNATRVTVELETDFVSVTDNSKDPSWVEHGAKPLRKKKTESEQPVITQEINVTQSEEKPFSCDFCGKGFNHKCNLTVHKRIHTGERPYKCNVCTESFMYSNYLKIHKLTHTRETPHKYDVCSKSFISNGSHFMMHKHLHTRERPQRCDSSLKRHKCTHTGGKP